MGVLYIDDVSCSLQATAVSVQLFTTPSVVSVVQQPHYHSMFFQPPSSSAAPTCTHVHIHTHTHMHRQTNVTFLVHEAKSMICVCRGVKTQGVLVLQHWGVLGVCTHVHMYVCTGHTCSKYIRVHVHTANRDKWCLDHKGVGSCRTVL